MPKQESVQFISQNLSIGDIRYILEGVVDNASISPIEYNALQEPADIGICIETHSLFARRRGFIQFEASDNQEFRIISITAIWPSLGDQMLTALAKEGLLTQTSKAGSLNLRDPVVSSLRRADPNIREA